jgi:hypothetical protein
MELNGIEVLNSSIGVIDIILNYVNGQVIVLISTLSNWFGVLSNRKPKSRIQNHNGN